MSNSRKGFTQIRQHFTSADSGEDVKGTILHSDFAFLNQYIKARVVVPEGWKLVPIKPTRNMIDAAHDSGYIDHYEAEITWEIMVAAAQEPSEQEPAE
jgi:hypothetical protein